MEEVPSTLANILEKTEFPYLTTPSFQWMSGIEELYPFFDWFVNSITEENFVTNDEMLCYNHIMKSGKLLNEEELDLRISNYICPQTNIHLEESNVEGLQDVIEYKRKVLNNLCSHRNRLKSELEKQELETFDSTVDQLLQNVVSKIHKVHKEYMSQFRILDKKFELLCENISSLENNESRYICQKSLKQYELPNAYFDIYIEVAKKKILEEKSTSISDITMNLDPLNALSSDDLMNRLFCWLSHAEYNAGFYRAKESAANEVLKYLSDCDDNIENLNFFFGCKNKNSFKNTVRPNEDELLTSCEFYTKDVIRGIQLNICKSRYDKRKKTLTVLEELEYIVKTRKLCNDSLHFLLMNEWKIIRGSVSLLQDINNYWKFNISDFKKRMAWMKRLIIKEQMPKLANNTFENEVSQSFMETLTLSGDKSYQDVNSSCIMQLHTAISQHITDFKNYSANIGNIISEVKKVDKFMFVMPTRVVHFNDKITSILKEIERLIKSVSVTDLVNEYHNYQASLEKEKDLLHMMWYEWNRNAFDVIQTILKMEEAAKIIKRRHSMLVEQELSTVQFKEYSRF